MNIEEMIKTAQQKLAEEKDRKPDEVQIGTDDMEAYISHQVRAGFERQRLEGTGVIAPDGRINLDLLTRDVLMYGIG